MTQHTSGTHSKDHPGQTPGTTAHVIVVGLDGSPASWDAFCWASGEAARSNGRLIAVYATPLAAPFPSPGEAFDYDTAEQACQETARQLADEASQRASELAVPLSFIRESGDVIRALTSVARSARADLDSGRPVDEDTASPGRLGLPAARLPARRARDRGRALARPYPTRNSRQGRP